MYSYKHGFDEEDDDEDEQYDEESEENYDDDEKFNIPTASRPEYNRNYGHRDIPFYTNSVFPLNSRASQNVWSVGAKNNLNRNRERLLRKDVGVQGN